MSHDIRGVNIQVGFATKRGLVMDRRTFLKTPTGTDAVAVVGGIAAPAISQRAASRALRFVPQADLSNFDPIWTTGYVVRNASMLVWDTLYGVDDKLQPQREMVEVEELSRLSDRFIPAGRRWKGVQAGYYGYRSRARTPRTPQAKHEASH